MFEAVESFRQFDYFSVLLRLGLAMFFGGVIGLEGGRKGRPAGFRTYMLVCLGAALTMLLGQYELQMTEVHWADHQQFVGARVDVSRFGAQVINGIGFLGAGFYEGGLTVTALVLLAELFFSKVERLVLRKSPEMNLYLRYEDSETMERILTFLRDNRIKVLSMEITRPKGSEKHKATAIFLLRLDKKISRKDFPEQLEDVEGVASVEVLSC